MQYRIIPTADGSRTLYLPQIDEQYHSLNGAVTESVHVFIDMGYMFQSVGSVYHFVAMVPAV